MVSSRDGRPLASGCTVAFACVLICFSTTIAFAQPTISLEPSQSIIAVGETIRQVVRVDNLGSDEALKLLLQASPPELVQIPEELLFDGTSRTIEFSIRGLREGGPVTILATLAGVSATREVTVAELTPAPTLVEPIVARGLVVAGRSVAGAVIQLKAEGKILGFSTAESDGVFAVQVPALGAGSVLSARATLRGIASDWTAPITVRESPPPPLIRGPAVAGTRNVRGSGAPGAVADVYVDGVWAAADQISTDGTFLAVVTDLLEGQTLTASQTLSSRSSKMASPERVVRTPPPPRVAGSVVAGDAWVSGSGVPGALVEVFVDGEGMGFAIVNATGLWSFRLSSPVRQKQIVEALQAIGEVVSARSKPVLAVAVASVPVVDMLFGDSVIGHGTPTASLRLLVDGDSAGETSIRASGEWVLHVTDPLEGRAVVQAVETVRNVVGGISPTLQAADVAVSPRISPPLVKNSTSVTGLGVPKRSHQLFVDEVLVGAATAAPNGKFEFSLPEALQAGQVVQVVAGDGTLEDTDGAVRVAMTPPGPSLTGPLAAAQVTVFGEGAPNASVLITVNGQDAGSTAVDSFGEWAFVFSQPLSTGQTVSATQVLAGQESDRAEPLIVGEAVLTPTAEDPSFTAIPNPDLGPPTSALQLAASAIGEAPIASSLFPISDQEASVDYVFEFADPNSAGDLGVVNVLINNFLDGVSACYLAFDQRTDWLFLVRDEGGGIDGGPLSASLILSNSQCSVDLSSASSTRTAFTLALNVSIEFEPDFAGDKVVFMAARDEAGNNSGWQPMGVKRVPGPGFGSSFPFVSSLSPSEGSGSSQVFTASYLDAANSLNLSPTQFLINDALNGENACYLGYDHISNNLFLVDDDGGTLLPGVTPGLNGQPGSGSMENSQCVINGAGTTTVENGATLGLSVDVTFKPAFVGRRIVYAASQTVSLPTGNSGWQAVGAYVVELAQP